MTHRLAITLSIALFAAALSACTTSQEACTSYGYTKGTAAHAGCVERRSRDIAASGARMSTLLDTPAYTPPPMAPPPRQQICQWVGNQFNCW